MRIQMAVVARNAVLLSALVISGAGWAEEDSNDAAAESQLVSEARNLLQAGRKEIISGELNLDAEESAAFWSVYEVYHADMMVVRDRYADMIGGYLARYEEADLDDEYAEEFFDDWVKYKSDKLKIQKRYKRKFERAMLMRNVVRFYQLENKMDAEIDIQLAVLVPLMEPN